MDVVLRSGSRKVVRDLMQSSVAITTTGTVDLMGRWLDKAAATLARWCTILLARTAMDTRKVPLIVIIHHVLLNRVDVLGRQLVVFEQSQH